MIQEFENRLAVVLGDGLEGPFANRVFAAGLEPDDTAAKIRLGAIRHQPWLPDFGSTRSERVPGNQDFRRVLRLSVDVSLEIVAAAGEGRSQRRAGSDNLLYLLELPGMADGTLLETQNDQGFLIEALKLVDASLPLEESPGNLSKITVNALGWFWPAGQAGEAGVAIAETHIRTSNMEIQLIPKRPEILAGGPAIDLTLQIRGSGFRLIDGQSPAALGLEFLALELAGAQGGPGLGTLQGDTQGANGLVLVNVDQEGRASLTYTPPAQPGKDLLAISLAQGGVPANEKRPGKTLATLELNAGAP